MKRRGFTVVELIVVVVVVGVITGVAIPSFRSMYTRNVLPRGKAMVQDAILDAKSRAATGTEDWQVIFDGSANTISSGPMGGAISDINSLPDGCTFSASGLDLTYEFYRDGTAGSSGGVEQGGGSGSIGIGGVVGGGSVGVGGTLVTIETNSFSIENERGEAVSFTLVEQIGEVSIGIGVVSYDVPSVVEPVEPAAPSSPGGLR